MDEMIPFLRTIAENPDDDTPRLVFADWLDEHEHHERAEFIRLQIELARNDPGEEGYAEKTARMRRCGMLTQKGNLPFFDYLPNEKCKLGFQRGFIESINTLGAEEIDTSGFDIVPLQALCTNETLVNKFKEFTHLKWFEFHEERETTPAKLLEILGPNGWFKNIEELSLPSLNTMSLEAGVIPKFDLPKLRNFYLSTEAFYEIGAPARNESDVGADDFYTNPRPWDGLPAYLPKNAIPNSKAPLERFVWHSDDDCDYFSDEDWYWRGPDMESLLTPFKGRNLKQIEVAVDYEDHENGAEGVITAPYQKSPLELCTSLERVTLSGDDLRLLGGSTQKLKSLRIYEAGTDDYLFTLLQEPICSELESLHVDDRYGWWGREATAGPGIHFPSLRSLYLSGTPFVRFSNCQFPNLLSLTIDGFKAILDRNWPKLQILHLYANDISDLKSFARSDCCPNLTTLTIDGYFRGEDLDLSQFTNCPHMPHLSLIMVSSYPEAVYIVGNGEIIPLRKDVMIDPQKHYTPYRFSAVF